MKHSTHARAQRGAAVRASALYSRSLIEASLDPLVMISATGKVTDVNRATEQATGRPREELIGTDFADYVTEPEKARAAYKQVLESGSVTDYPLAIRHVSGRIMDVLCNASLYRDEAGAVVGVFAAARDVTETKKLQSAHEMLARIVESADDAIVSETLDGIITSWNHGAELMLGYSAAEAIGRPAAMLAPPGRESEIRELIEAIRAGKIVRHHGTRRRKKDGTLFHVSISVSPIKDSGGALIGMSVIYRDITERVRAAKEQRQAALYSRSLIEASLDPLVTISVAGKVTDVNRATEQATGRSRKELIGTDFADYFTEPEKARAGYRRVLESGSVTDYPLAIRHVSGRIMDVLYNASLYRDEAGAVAGVFAAARDVTETKKLQNAHEMLARIVESAEDAIVSETLDGMITSWNHGAELMLGYSPAEAIGRPAAMLAPPGREHEIRELIETIRTGKIVRQHETRRRKKDGTLFHVSISVSPVKDASGALIGMSVIYRDITERVRVEQERERNREKIEKGMEATVQAVANMVEIRDPYTAGHQRRVAELAVAIAHELALPEDRIRGLSLAAAIHDIGKIEVPSEILNRPGALSPLELQLIRCHPQTGHDILKNVDLAWPIADIILQHHERLDGSGYPQGLHGDAILLEAKIIAVADVLESMASHRPYRPALGIPTALDELRRGRGMLFDADVVDACVRLIETGAFKVDK